MELRNWLVVMMRLLSLLAAVLYVASAQADVQKSMECTVVSAVPHDAIAVNTRDTETEEGWLYFSLDQLLNNPVFKHSPLVIKGIPGQQLRQSACNRLRQKGFVDVSFLNENWPLVIPLDVEQSLAVLFCGHPVNIITPAVHQSWLSGVSSHAVVFEIDELTPDDQCPDRYVLGIAADELQAKLSGHSQALCGQWLAFADLQTLQAHMQLHQTSNLQRKNPSGMYRCGM